MKTWYRILLCVIMLSVFMILSNCGNDSHSETSEKNKEELGVPVEVAEVIRGDISAFFTGTTTMEAEEGTEVVAKVGGVVKELFIEEGDHVTKGQVLAKLDDEKITVQVEQARATLQKLENEYQRSEELFQKQLISVEAYQSAKFDYESQKASYELAQLDLNYTSIQSPIDGVVFERLIKVGNMIQPHQPVFKVTGLDPLLAVLYVPEKQIDKLQVGHQAKLRVDALNEAVFFGRIDRISPVVDPATGTVKVTIEVRNSGAQLKPGMFARIQVIHDIRRNTLLVPKDAIITEDKATSVFVVQDSSAYRRSVKTGYVNTVHIEILEGIALGDTIVTTGKGSLKDSTRVDPVAFVSHETIQLD